MVLVMKSFEQIEKEALERNIPVMQKEGIDFLIDTLNDIISGYPGKSPVLVQYNKKLYPLGLNVEPSNALVAEISRIIGQDNIKII